MLHLLKMVWDILSTLKTQDQRQILISIPQDIFPEFYNVCDETKKNQNILGSRNVQVFSLEMIC